MQKSSLSLAVLVSLVAALSLLRPGSASADLALDPAFGSAGIAEQNIGPGADAARGIGVTADGSLVLAGTSRQVVGPDLLDFVVLTRLNGATGALDATFGTVGVVQFLPGITASTGGGGDGRAVAIQEVDQKIVVAGNWNANDGMGSQLFVARFTADGMPDAGFGASGVALISPAGVTSPSANGLALRSDGSIVIVGSALLGADRVGIVLAITGSGNPDPGFPTAVVSNPLANGEGFGFNAVAVLSGDRVLAAGGGGDLTLAQFTSAGAPDVSFGGDGIANINVLSFESVDGPFLSFDLATAITVLEDGRILVAGRTANTSSLTATNRVLARVSSVGELDATFGSGGFAPLADAGQVEIPVGIGARPSGDIVLVGRGFPPTQISPSGISFNTLPGTFSPVLSNLKVLGDGSIVAAGERQLTPPGNSAFVAARITATDLVDGPDTVPDPYSFALQEDVVPGQVVTSNTVPITGLDAPASIMVSGGDSYSVGCSVFVTVPGTITNGQTVCVRTTALTSDLTIQGIFLNISGVPGFFTFVTGDATPDAFAFVDQEGDPRGTGIPASTVRTSAPITLNGLTTQTSISVTGVGASYSVGCTATYISTPSTAGPGAQVCVRHTSSATPGGVTDTVLRVGIGTIVQDTFTSITAGGVDTIPDQFDVPDQFGVNLYALITSEPVPIFGITGPTPVSVSGGAYSVGCTSTYTAAVGSISPGQSVCVRQLSSFDNSSTVDTVLTIGGVSATFATTTRDDGDQTPTTFSFDPQTDLARNTVVTSNSITISGVDSPVALSATGPRDAFNRPRFGFSVGCTGTFDGVNGDIVQPGTSVCLGVITADADGESVVATLTIGGSSPDSQVSGTFTATTGLTVPVTFSFPPLLNVRLDTVSYASPATITGITAPSRVEISSNGQFQIGCTGDYTSGPGLVRPGQLICVRQVPVNSFSTRTDTVLTVGGVSATFSTTTTDKALPGSSSLDPLSLLVLGPLLWGRRRQRGRQQP